MGDEEDRVELTLRGPVASESDDATRSVPASASASRLSRRDLLMRSSPVLD